jgi:hypothetical protein
MVRVDTVEVHNEWNTSAQASIHHRNPGWAVLREYNFNVVRVKIAC